MNENNELVVFKGYGHTLPGHSAEFEIGDTLMVVIREEEGNVLHCVLWDDGETSNPPRSGMVFRDEVVAICGSAAVALPLRGSNLLGQANDAV